MTYLSRVRQKKPFAIKTGRQPGLFGGLIRMCENGRLKIGTGEACAGLSELRDLGLVAPKPDPDAGAVRLAGGVSPETILPCIDLMDRIKIALLPLVSDGCPVEFCSGFVEYQDLSFAEEIPGRLIAVGQGPSQAAASLACLGEMAERLSLLSRGEGDPLILHESFSDVSAAASLNFSEGQQALLTEEFPALKANYRNGQIHWEEICDRRIRVASLTGEKTGLAPSLVCLLREGGGFKVPGAPITSSNGAAAWWNYEGARERAVMELIERDSVACWWYNRLIPERYSISEMSPWLPGALADWFAQRERRIHFLRLATDLNCTVIAAISHDRNGKGLAYGFKAALALEDAVGGAALELVQMEMHLQTIADYTPSDEQEDYEHPLMRMSQGIDVTANPWLAGNREAATAWPEAATWAALLDCLDERSIPVWSFEATRPDIGVPTVKAISPALRDWSPRFGAGRLYSLPVSLGMRSSALREQDLNPLRFVT